jgi:hypothetical protein
VYAITPCAVENLDRDYRNRNIYNLSGSLAAIKALDNHQINSKLVGDCYQFLIKMAEKYSTQLIWVPDNRGIEGNETANHWHDRSECPFMGNNPASGISAGIAKKTVRDWTNRYHQKYWESSTGPKHAKGFLNGPSARRIKELY